MKNVRTYKLHISLILVANPCDARDCFKSNVNISMFKHFSNFNY